MVESSHDEDETGKQGGIGLDLELGNHAAKAHIKWHSMSLETARATFTYAAALFVIVGGFAFLYLTRAEPEATDLTTIVAGFIGAALQFLFGAQVAQQTRGTTNGNGTH